MTRDNKFTGVLIGGAIGDALGWPFEFSASAVTNKDKKSGYFIDWSKRIGGAYWGYDDSIEAGSYSDDTQLTIAVARCIDFDGNFLREKFAYEELPLWLQYERGGGRATKYAIRSLLDRKTTTWDNNFFKSSEVTYRGAGANGVAMRSAPIVMAGINKSSESIAQHLTENAIITHGHPRAIIGSYLISSALMSVLRHEKLDTANLKELANELCFVGREYISSSLNNWIAKWNEEGGNFLEIYNQTVIEMNQGLDLISSANNVSQVVSSLKANTFNNKGSGIDSTLVAISTHLLHSEEMGNALKYTAYYPGIDTDTISSMLGWLIGAQYGKSAFDEHLVSNVQDVSYLEKLGNMLFNIAEPKSGNQTTLLGTLTTGKRDYLSRVWAWEVGMFEMFWDAIEVDSVINHPTLGRGTVIYKFNNEVAYERTGKGKYYNANVKIRFDEGQTCSFHAVVNESGLPDSSLTKRLESILK